MRAFKKLIFCKKQKKYSNKVDKGWSTYHVNTKESGLSGAIYFVHSIFILFLFQSFSFTSILQAVKLTDGSGRYWITGSESDPT